MVSGFAVAILGGGHIPLKQVTFPNWGYDSLYKPGRVDVDISGTILVFSNGYTRFVNLDGIVFATN
jgi:hypothetical protein